MTRAAMIGVKCSWFLGLCGDIAIDRFDRFGFEFVDDILLFPIYFPCDCSSSFW